jgi:nicotinamide-nucleotide adenylyltransferase
MKTALFLGRFQPFHKGHLSAVRNALKEAGKIVIAIGSSQESYTKKNPFTAKERRKMINAALEEAKISHKKYSIVEIEDVLYCDREWVKHVLEKVPGFDVIYTGNRWTKKCFKDIKGIKVKNVRKEVDVCSTRIRKLFLKGGWEKYVPKAAVKEIRKIKGIKRIKEIYNS